MAIVTEQLLSFIGVDLAELDVYVGGRYCVIQRDPQPSEIDISQNTNIIMALVDLEGDPGGSVSLDFDFDLYVNGAKILQFASGTPTWVGGFWTGTVEMAAVTDPYFFYRVTAQQVVPPFFISEQVVPVRVVINPSTPDLDTTYSFTVEDLTPPSIISAEPLDQHTVRVTFDDNMATSGVGSALLPSAYSIVTLNEDPFPGVELEVVGVTEVSGSNATMFDLEMDWEQTPGCSYRIDVDPGVTDSSGNAIQ